MARITIDLPDRYSFQTEVTVRTTDLNYGGHLGNDSMLSLIHEARVQFLASRGATERDVYGTRIVLGDAAIVYRAEAFAGDVLRFEVAARDIARVGCDLVYYVTRDQAPVAHAKTGIVFLDPKSKRPVAVPEQVHEW